MTIRRSLALSGLFLIAVLLVTGLITPQARADDEPGNSGAAHACQQGGYKDLRRSDGTTFRNTGDCVSYAAHGGALLQPADLTTTKVCAPTTVASGATTTCTITVRNAAGAAPALVPSGATLVRDTITGTTSTGATITSFTGPSGYTCTNGTVISGSLVANCTATTADSIAGGDSRVFTVTEQITNYGTIAQQVTDTATANPNNTIDERPTSNNQSAPASVTVLPSPPDLTTTKSCTPTRIASGASSVCTITVTNSGAGPATVASGTQLVRDTITGTVNTDTTITSFTGPSGYSCTTGTVISGSLVANCTATAADTIATGATRVFTVTERITNAAAAAQQVTDTGAADPTNAIIESNENNNTSTAATVAVAPVPPDLTVTKTCPTNATSGTVFTCTITVTNNGTTPAQIPAGTILARDRFTGTVATSTSVTGTGPAGYSCAPGTVVTGAIQTDCVATAADTIAPGGSRTFNYSVTVTSSASTAQTATNQATTNPNCATTAPAAAGGIVESNCANNQSTPVNSILVSAPLPDLAVAKSCPASVTGGSTLACTITLTNGGGTAATFSSGQAVLRDTSSRQSGSNVNYVATLSRASGGTGSVTCAQTLTPPDAFFVDCNAGAGGFTINPGETVSFALTGTATAGTTGSSVITDVAVADPNRVVTESDEGNNTSTASTTVASAGRAPAAANADSDAPAPIGYFGQP